MVDKARDSQDIRMQQDMWSTFCMVVRWSIIGIAILLILMYIFLV